MTLFIQANVQMQHSKNAVAVFDQRKLLSEGPYLKSVELVLDLVEHPGLTAICGDWPNERFE